MGRGLFRRVAGRGRVRRAVRRASAPVVGADGKRYKVIAVNEAEATEFADPPRKWGRVGAMAATWALLLALGAWVAPGFAASGSTENESSQDKPATDPKGAALRYLDNGANNDVDLARAALCEGASPELTPEGLDAIRQSYTEASGVTDIAPKMSDPVFTADGIVFTGTIQFVSGGNQPAEQFTVTVQENDGTYCVSNAVHVQEDDSGSGDPTSELPDPEALANGFMTQIVGNRDVETAAAMQCEPYVGITAEDLDAAVAAWETRNGWKTGSSRGAIPIDDAESSITLFSVEVKLEGSLSQTFTFEVGVQGDCIASLEGGDQLMDLIDD